MIKTVISFNMNQLISMSKQVSNRYKPDVYTIHKFVYSLFPKELNAKFSINKELIKKIDFIGCKVYHYESANHSLEIKYDWLKTIDYLKQTVAIFQEVMEG